MDSAIFPNLNNGEPFLAGGHQKNFKLSKLIDRLEGGTMWVVGGEHSSIGVMAPKTDVFETTQESHATSYPCASVSMVELNIHRWKLPASKRIG